MQQYQAPPYTGFWRRLLASLMDSVLLLVAAAVIGILVALLIALVAVFTSSTGSGDKAYAVGYLGAQIFFALFFPILIVLGWLYHTLFEASSMRGTVGKLMLHAVVADEQGRRISWGRANARYWSKALSNLTIGIGYLLAAFDDRKRALHDMIAGTVVVARERTGELALGAYGVGTPGPVPATQWNPAQVQGSSPVRTLSPDGQWWWDGQRWQPVER